MRHRTFCAVLTCLALFSPVMRAADAAPTSIWSRGNLYPWCVVPYDAKKRGPEERAQMLHDLGFTQFAYDWRDKDVPTFDAEITALQKKGITLLAWWCPQTANDPKLGLILETCKRHAIHPQLWVKGGGAPTRSPEEQQRRVLSETARIKALVKLAAPYGCPIELYNHNGWFGQEDNQLAIIEQLKTDGISDVGMVYNFSHTHDAQHDDTVDFPALWRRIQSHVVAVNVTGMGPTDKLVYPSQGTNELAMMRVIAQSGWKGPVGIIAEKGGDAAVTLANYRTGVVWLAAELQQAESGGPRPAF